MALTEEAKAALSSLEAQLALEENEAKARAQALFEDSSDKVLEERGVLLKGGVLEEEAGALFGRVRLTVSENPARKGHLERFEVRPGAVVRLRMLDDDEKLVPGPAGIVVQKTPRRLRVVFDEAVSVNTKGVHLVRVEDEVTLRRLKEGLRTAAKLEGRQAEVLEVLLGVRDPSPTEGGALTPLDDALNDDQKEAVRHATFAPDVGLVHGPPGTGKTRVVVEVVRQLLDLGERVLCLTASNAAIDHVAIGLVERDATIPLARVGHPARVHPALESHTLVALTDQHERRQLAKKLIDEAFRLLANARRRSDSGKEAWRREREARAEAGKMFADARQLERQAAEEVLRKTRVLCGTLTGYTREIPHDLAFDVLVVDEASQALTPALLLGLPRVSRVVLAGDHKQLPPTVLSRKAADAGLSETAFDRLMSRDDAEGFGHMLTVQHRMHEQLMTFSSARFYDDALTAHATVAAHTLVDLDVDDGPLTVPERPFDFIDTAGAGWDERGAANSESRENPQEAAQVAKVVAALIDGGLAANDVGVITPYAAQAALLADALADHLDDGLEVDSVDGFQGREKEAIVFSAVRSNANGEVGFLADARRLNVAITRARRKLVVIGDSATLGRDPSWSALVDHAIAQGGYRSCFELMDL